MEEIQTTQESQELISSNRNCDWTGVILAASALPVSMALVELVGLTPEVLRYWILAIKAACQPTVPTAAIGRDI